MDALALTYRTQSEIADLHEDALADATNVRWTAVQHYAAINAALDDWGRRVLVPFLYPIAGGFVKSTVEYALPNYMDSFIRVQQLIPANAIFETVGEEADVLWMDVDFFSVDPTAAGGRVLRLRYDPRTVDARILWYATNSPVPTTVPILDAEITAADTSLVLTSKPRIGHAGYIKCGDEIMSYNGYLDGSSTKTLNNLVRGLDGTTAAIHADAAPVQWCVGVHRTDLFDQMRSRALVYLMNLKLNNASPQEREVYWDQMRYNEQKANEYWHRFAPLWQPRLKLSRQVARIF